MSDNDTVNEIFGGVTKTDSNEDWKAKYEEAEKQLQSARVEQGRVKALDARAKELEKELAELKEAKSVTNLTETLTAEEREALPEEYIGAAAKIASRASNEALAGLTEEVDRLRRERDAEKTAANQRKLEGFVAQIDAKYPGFRSAVAPGGDKKNAWDVFLRRNAGSVNEAFKSLDFDALTYHIDRFYREDLGVRPPEGNGAVAVPDPVSTGGTGVETLSDGKTYSQSEIDKMYDDIEAARDAQDFSRVRKLSAILERAIREGRVK